MTMTVLEIAQRVAGRLGLPRPTSLVSNTDAQVVQLLGMLNKVGEDLGTRREEWFDASWVVDHSGPGPVAKQYISRDDDTFALPDPIPLNWLEWRWKSEKGLDYAEAFAAYERLVSMYKVKAVDKEVLDATQIGPGRYDVAPIYPYRWLSRRP